MLLFELRAHLYVYVSLSLSLSLPLSVCVCVCVRACVCVSTCPQLHSRTFGRPGHWSNLPPVSGAGTNLKVGITYPKKLVVHLHFFWLYSNNYSRFG